MSVELLYTSAPQGLKQGSRGFSTVLCTNGLPINLATRLEGLSGYRHVFPPNHAQASSNPVCYSHLRFVVGGKSISILSRISDYGIDYSQRTNKLAHHIALDTAEQPAAGPAWLLSQPGLMRSAWDGTCKTLPAGPSIPQADQAPSICHTWQSVTGDAGWGGVIADAFVSNNPKPTWIVFKLEQSGLLLKLLNEAIALLPPHERWRATFSTYVTNLPPEVDCKVRCVLEGSDEARAALAKGSVIRIFVASKVEDESANVSRARSGAAFTDSATNTVLSPRLDREQVSEDAFQSGATGTLSDELDFQPPAKPQAPPSVMRSAKPIPMPAPALSPHRNAMFSSKIFPWMIGGAIFAIVLMPIAAVSIYFALNAQVATLARNGETESERAKTVDDSAIDTSAVSAKPEAPKPESTKPESTKPEDPKPEDPKPEDPKPEDPKPEDPKPEDPKPEDPKPENPKPENPKPETPKPIEGEAVHPKSELTPSAEPKGSPLSPTVPIGDESVADLNEKDATPCRIHFEKLLEGEFIGRAEVPLPIEKAELVWISNGLGKEDSWGGPLKPNGMELADGKGDIKFWRLHERHLEIVLSSSDLRAKAIEVRDAFEKSKGCVISFNASLPKLKSLSIVRNSIEKSESKKDLLIRSIDYPTIHEDMFKELSRKPYVIDVREKLKFMEGIIEKATKEGDERDVAKDELTRVQDSSRKFEEAVEAGQALDRKLNEIKSLQYIKPELIRVIKRPPNKLGPVVGGGNLKDAKKVPIKLSFIFEYRDTAKKLRQ